MELSGIDRELLTQLAEVARERDTTPEDLLRNWLVKEAGLKPRNGVSGLSHSSPLANTTYTDHAPEIPITGTVFEQFFDVALDIHCILENGTFVRVNPAVEQVLGYEPPDLIDCNFVDLVHADDQDRTQQQLSRLARPGTVWQFEARHHHRNGQYRWLSWTASHAGDHGLVYAVGRDITEQHAIIDALYQTETTLQSLLNSGNELAILLEPDGAIITANDAAALTIGIPPEQLTDSNLLDLMGPDWYEAVAHVIRTQTATSIEFNYRTRIYNCTFYPVFSTDGASLRQIAVFAHDVTVYRQTESELRRSQERFRRILSSASEGILLVDQTGTILMANERIGKLFGYSTHEMIGMPIDDLVPEKYRDHHASHRANYMDSPYVRQMIGTDSHLYARRRDGTVFPAEISLSYIRMDNELVVMCFVTDITSRKKMEQQHLLNTALQLRLQKEREVVALKERFINLMAHELRTPLAIISSSAQMIERYHENMSQERLVERIQRMSVQVNRLNRMFDNILALNDTRESALQFEPVALDVTGFCQTLISNLIDLDPTSDRINLIVDDRIPDRVTLDRQLLEHILTNLLTNALKYSEAPAPVDLIVDRAEREVVFTIRDRGIGIPENSRQELFEPFFRAENTGDVPGTGLGLVVVRDCVEVHGGTISVTSAEGEGTTFRVTLPDVDL